MKFQNTGNKLQKNKKHFHKPRINTSSEFPNGCQTRTSRAMPTES